jgi:hypothetical protein
MNLRRDARDPAGFLGIPLSIHRNRERAFLVAEWSPKGEGSKISHQEGVRVFPEFRVGHFTGYYL